MTLQDILRTATKGLQAYTEISFLAYWEKLGLQSDFWTMMTPFRKSMVQWFFTKGCNIRCDYCHVPGSAKDDLSIEERIVGLDIVNAVFHPRVVSISGGEPTLKFKELLEFASHGYGLGMLVGMNTNGLLLDEGKIRELKRAHLTYLSFSYDGIPPKDDDSVLEKAAFASNIGIFTSLQPVFSAKNWHLRYRIMDQAAQAGTLFNPAIVNAIGGAYSTATERAPPRDEVRSFYGELLSRPDLTLRPSKRFMRMVNLSYDEPWRCSKFSWITVDHDGTLKHCNEYESPFSVNDLRDPKKRSAFADYRRTCRDSCPGCYYECYHASESPFLKMVWLEEFIRVSQLARLVLARRNMDMAGSVLEKYFPEMMR